MNTNNMILFETIPKLFLVRHQNDSIVLQYAKEGPTCFCGLKGAGAQSKNLEECEWINIPLWGCFSGGVNFRIHLKAQTKLILIWAF